MALYSAMIRVGEMPLNSKFLMHDPLNFSIPIVYLVDLLIFH